MSIKRILFFAVILLLMSSGLLYAQNTVKTKVGEPKGAEGGWPTTGIITQGPLGAYDHGPLHLNALDISNLSSPPIYSTFDGTVTEVHDCSAAGDCSLHYGNSVRIQNDTGGISLYGHLAVVEVASGQRVQKGERLGIMGTTGFSTGIHLHFELIGIPLAPPYIPHEVTPANCDSDDGISGIPCSPSPI